MFCEVKMHEVMYVKKKGFIYVYGGYTTERKVRITLSAIIN